MIQYKIEEMTLRTAAKACLLIACAGIINFVFNKFIPEGSDDKG